MVILVLPVDDLIARHAVCHDNAGVVGGGVAVDRYAVERARHRILQCAAQQGRINRTVGGDKAQHRAHIRVNHAGALGDAAHPAGLSAAVKFDCRRLFDEIGRHNRAVRRSGAVLRQLICQLRHAALNRLDIQLLADDAGRADKNQIFLHADSLCRRLCHAARVFNALRRAGVRIAGIRGDHLCDAVLQMLHADVNRRRLDAVVGKGRRCRRTAFADNQRQIILLLRAARLDAAVHGCRAEALCGAHAAFDLLHVVYSFLSVSAPPVRRRPQWFHLVRPAVSSKPSIRFMFCTAAPDAPLPRLSNSAVIIVCSSCPQTISDRLSRPAMVSA